MWTMKRRRSRVANPLGIMLGIAATTMVVFFSRNMLRDVVRYVRMHRM